MLVDDTDYLSKETENPVTRQTTLPLRYEADFLDGADKLTKSTIELDQAVVPFRLNDDWALITRIKRSSIRRGLTMAGAVLPLTNWMAPPLSTVVAKAPPRGSMTCGRDPFRLCERPVGDDVATGGTVLVMDRLQPRVHVGRAVHRAPLRILAS
jgi:hypothetical protein